MSATVREIVTANERMMTEIREICANFDADPTEPGSIDNAVQTITVLRDADPILRIVGVAARDLDYCDQQIVDLTSRLGSRLGSLKASVEAGEHVARNGVLQQTGVELDRLCGERALRVEHLKMLLHAWDKQEAASQ